MTARLNDHNVMDAPAAALAAYRAHREAWGPVRDRWLEEYAATVRRSRDRHVAVRVLAVLTDWGFDTTGTQWQARSQQRCADLAGCSRDTVKRVMTRARKAGWLTEIGKQRLAEGASPSPLYALTRPGEGAWWLEGAA